MITILLIVLVLSIGLSVIVAFSPLRLGAWILILSIIVSVLCRTTFRSWFGFIIFLIYIGGMLVIFSYFVAIQPNQYFDLKTSMFVLVLRILNLPINIYPGILNLIYGGERWVSSLFRLNNIIILIILGVVLFLALIIVVKITINVNSSLRPFI